MPYDMTPPGWFLAQVKPNSAAIADKNLKRQGFETFLPMETQTRQRSGRFVTRKQPVFPGYIFVAIDPAQGVWRKVNATYGITKLVSFGAAPAEVPAELIAGLKARCDSNSTLLPPAALQVGDHVNVIEGPFADTIVEIERIDPDRRVWVLMDLMGRSTRTAMDAARLAPGMTGRGKPQVTKGTPGAICARRGV